MLNLSKDKMLLYPCIVKSEKNKIRVRVPDFNIVIETMLSPDDTITFVESLAKATLKKLNAEGKIIPHPTLYTGEEIDKLYSSGMELACIDASI